MRGCGNLAAVAGPTLVVVTGPAGTGKTTLAHGLSRSIGCPALCRDEIKEGMVHAAGGAFEASAGDELTRRTLPVFFGAVRYLLEAGVTVVAEAAFQDHLWRAHLEPMAGLARLRIVRCTTDPATAHGRVVGRLPRGAHADGSLAGADDYLRYHREFVPVSMDAATIDVDTSDGYRPSLETIVGWIGAGG